MTGYSFVYPSVARTLNARHDSSFCPDRGMNIVVVRREDDCAAGFVGKASPNAGSTGFTAGCAPTLRAGVKTDVIICLQGNSIDRTEKSGCGGRGFSRGGGDVHFEYGR